MPTSLVEELRLLIFQGSKPTLFPDNIHYLLPLLPAPLFPKAVGIAVRTDDHSLSGHILDAVTSRLSSADRDVLFNEQLREIQEEGPGFRQGLAIAALAAYLSPSQLQNALEIVLTINTTPGRVGTLAALVPHLSGTMPQEAVSQVAPSFVLTD